MNEENQLQPEENYDIDGSLYNKESSSQIIIKAPKKYSIYSQKENIENKIYICRLDYNTEDDENECSFCKISRTTNKRNWYAKCGLYNTRLKRFNNIDIAICCDECIKNIRKIQLLKEKEEMKK